MIALTLASVDCLCSCTCVCTCVCMGCIQVCMCLQVSIAFALVFRLSLHLHCTFFCIGVAMLLALQWCCTWIAPVFVLCPICIMVGDFEKSVFSLAYAHQGMHGRMLLVAITCSCTCTAAVARAVQLCLHVREFVHVWHQQSICQYLRHAAHSQL